MFSLRIRYSLPALLAVFCIISCSRQAPDYGREEAQRKAQLNDSLLMLDSVVFARKFGQRSEAIALARTALSLAAGADTQARIRALNIMGNAYNQLDADSCYKYYSAAMLLAEKARLIDSFPQVIYNMAHLYYQAVDYKNALMLFDSAIRMGTVSKDWDLVTDALNTSGLIYADIGMKHQAVQAFETALRLSKEHQRYTNYGITLTNLVDYEPDPDKKLLKYKEALRAFGTGSGDEKAKTSLLNNIGMYMPDPDSAIWYYHKSVEIATKMGFRDVLMLTNNNLAYAYLDQGDTRKADSVLTQVALPIALADSGFFDLATLCDSYADVLMAKGNHLKAMEYQKLAYQYLTRAEQKKAGEQVRLLSVLLEARNRELMIRNQETEIRLQKSLAHSYLVYFLFTAVLAAGLILLFIWYRQHTRFRLQKVSLESARRIIEAGEYEKAHIGRELHDIATHLSLGLRRVTDEVPFADETDRRKILDEIESVRLTVRELSHRMHTGTLGALPFSDLVAGLCEGIEKKGEILLDYSVSPEIPALDLQAGLHVFRIIQELLSNALRHAPGSSVELDVYWADSLVITCTDDGPGFDLQKASGSMGLMNIRDRLTLLGGTLTLETAPGQGTSWEIQIPVKTKPS
jgi:signal transduction histidine kinase